jgi:hypothetical protein
MEANWKPLETRLGASRCAGFMFMGCLNGINQYKHGLSRRYLFLDDEGRAYEAAGRNAFREVPFDEALARVEEPLKELGETLETACGVCLRGLYGCHLRQSQRSSVTSGGN